MIIGIFLHTPTVYESCTYCNGTNAEVTVLFLGRSPLALE